LDPRFAKILPPSAKEIDNHFFHSKGRYNPLHRFGDYIHLEVDFRTGFDFGDLARRGKQRLCGRLWRRRDVVVCTG
jgi:hypothetical protein